HSPGCPRAEGDHRRPQLSQYRHASDWPPAAAIGAPDSDRMDGAVRSHGMMRTGGTLALLVAAFSAGCADAVCTGMECLPVEQFRVGYALELVPPRDSYLVTEQYAELPIDTRGHAVLSFSAPIRLTGRVLIDDPVRSIPAHLTAVPSWEPFIPGRPLLFEAD